VVQVVRWEEGLGHFEEKLPTHLARALTSNTPVASLLAACCTSLPPSPFLTQVINRTLILTRVSYHLVSFVWFVGLFLIWESVVDLRGSRTSKQQP